MPCHAMPWFAIKKFELLRNDIENLVDLLDKYNHYLCEHTEVKSHQSELTFPSSEENASLITLPGSGGPTSSKYLNLEQKLANVEMYQPVFLNEITPSDRLERRWLANVQFPFTIMLYRYVSALLQYVQKYSVKFCDCLMLVSINN